MAGHRHLGVWMAMRSFGRIIHAFRDADSNLRTGRTTISHMSTSAGCSIANTMARAIVRQELLVLSGLCVEVAAAKLRKVERQSRYPTRYGARLLERHCWKLDALANPGWMSIYSVMEIEM